MSSTPSSAQTSITSYLGDYQRQRCVAQIPHAALSTFLPASMFGTQRPVPLELQRLKFEPMPAIRENTAAEPSSLIVNSSWLGRYYNPRTGHVGSGGWHAGSAKGVDTMEMTKADRRLRALMPPQLSCPTVNPINGNRFPVWERICTVSVETVYLIERMCNPLDFVHYDVSREEAMAGYLKTMLRGMIPPYWWRSSVTCRNCRTAKSRCYHASTLAPTARGVQLSCARCVLDSHSCEYEIELIRTKPASPSTTLVPTSIESRSVSLFAQYLPELPTREPFHLSMVWFEGYEEVSSAQTSSGKAFHPSIFVVRHIGGINIDTHGYEAFTGAKAGRKPDSLKRASTSDEERGQSSHRKRFRSWSDGETPDPLPLMHISIPLPLEPHPSANVFDLPSLNTVILSTLAVLRVNPPRLGLKPSKEDPATLSMVLTGNHLSPSVALERLPSDSQYRSAHSSKAFDLGSLSRKTLGRPIPWVDTPSADFESFLRHPVDSHCAPAPSSGWDDINERLATLRDFVNSHVDDPGFRLVWRRCRDSVIPEILQHPDLRRRLTVCSPAQLYKQGASLEKSAGFFAPQLLDLDIALLEVPESLANESVWSSISAPYSQAMMNALVARLMVGQTVEGRMGIVKAGGSEPESASSSMPWPKGWVLNKQKCRYLVGWMSRAGPGDIQLGFVTWYLKPEDRLFKVYDGLETQLDWYTKNLHMVLRSWHACVCPSLPLQLEFWGRPVCKSLTSARNTADTSPTAIFLLHAFLDAPGLHRNGIDEDAIGELIEDIDGNSSDAGLTMKGLAVIRQRHRGLLRAGLERTLMQEIQVRVETTIKKQIPES